jgi:hypothetical protein
LISYFRVQVVSGNYVNPDDLKFNVWTWDYSEPSLSDGCVAMLPSTRWATLDCSTALPFACLKDNSTIPVDWAVDLEVKGSFQQASCPSGSHFAAPHTGYTNNLLSLAGLGQGMWVNTPNPLKK